MAAPAPLELADTTDRRGQALPFVGTDRRSAGVEPGISTPATSREAA
jgi:hypothetical protein